MDYQALVLDMDGTLYYQLPVRVWMFLSLIAHYVVRPHKLKELLLLREYRKLREQRAFSESNDIDQSQLAFLAEKYQIATESASAIIEHWMQDSAQGALAIARDKTLISLATRFRDNGGILIIYSDYPVQKKLQAIGLVTDYTFHSGDPTIQCMKPDKRGLESIMKIVGLSADDILFIGDRYDRDGLCAAAVNMDYLILDKGMIARHRKVYRGVLGNLG
jgi:FMN phosphatase YigB (HAD superfamily)